MSARLSDEVRARLLALARDAIARRLEGHPPPDLEDGEPPRAVFVTLRERAGGALRGCIGQTLPRHPLSEAIVKAAASAATADPRFEPVRATELSGLSIEISVLSPFEPAEPAEVEVGKHGVFLEWRGRRGLFLPQVALEQAWDAETLLNRLCLKAGAPPGIQAASDAHLQVFTAEVFGDEAHEGPVL